MSQPLLATGRIVFPITTASLVHKYVAYVRNLTVVGGTYNVNTRTTDSNDLAWTDAAQGWWLSFSYMMATGVSAPTALLETLSGGVWTPVASVLCTGGNGTGGVQNATQLTATYRDTAFKKFKLIVLEGNFTPPFAASTVTAFGGGITNGLKQWTSASTVTNAPYLWQVSRGDRYLNTASFVHGVATYNRKLRKARGVA